MQSSPNLSGPTKFLRSTIVWRIGPEDSQDERREVMLRLHVVDDLELVEDGEKDMVPGLCEKA